MTADRRGRTPDVDTVTTCALPGTRRYVIECGPSFSIF